MISVWLHTNLWSWREIVTHLGPATKAYTPSCSLRLLFSLITAFHAWCAWRRSSRSYASDRGGNLGPNSSGFGPRRGCVPANPAGKMCCNFSTMSVCLTCSILTWLLDIHRWWSRCLQPHIRYWGLRRRLLLFICARLLKVSRAGDRAGFSQTIVSIPRSLKTRIGNVTWCIEWPS
jgi:hypothetical protein